ncbi:MAG: hypothetical protein KC609_12740 [Myxococcales bacterium]|nr:hypothetical protein [Myxococcales bacterium]
MSYPTRPRARALYRVALFAALATLASACDAPRRDGVETPYLHSTKQLIPSALLPDDVKPQTSNNNLDVIEFEGRLYLVFRTGPSHFASPLVMLHLVSRPLGDETSRWRHEVSISMNTDLREPRFFAFGSRLFLYFASLGASRTAFEPGKMWRIERLGDATYSEPTPVFVEGFIPWRIKWRRGRAYLLGYDGGENIYNFSGEPLHVYFLTTDNGTDWHAVVEGKAIVHTGGCSETDFEFLGDGSLIAVLRNEAGDQDGFGSKICRAPANALADWSCKPDKRKYDSPLLFARGDAVYLIARRNISATGNYDLGRDELEYSQKLLQYQVDYWTRPKRCSLWRVDVESQHVDWIFDLPSRGDTCFPSILVHDEQSYDVYNYSSALDGKDISWQQGQGRPTFIFRSRLSFLR